MINNILDSGAYSVVFAERRDIGDEWNKVKWDRNHKEIGYHRLYLLTEGRAEMKLKTGTLELAPGRVYFIPAFSVLSGSISGKMNKYYVHFQVDSTLFDIYRYLSDELSVPATPITETLFDTVIENYTSLTVSSRLKVQGAMNLIMSDFISGINADKMTIMRFSPVLEYINGNFTRDIRLDELAGMMKISTMYFSNIFKKVFNISPKQYILNKRLVESQRLLLETELSVKEIACAVGFDNENYFSEFFSARVGIPALKFRSREIPRTRDSIL